MESLCDDPDVIATNILVKDFFIYLRRNSNNNNFLDHFFLIIFFKGGEGVQPGLP